MEEDAAWLWLQQSNPKAACASIKISVNAIVLRGFREMRGFE